MELSHNKVYRNIFFVMFMIALGYLLLRVMLPYLDVALLAFIVVQAFYPLKLFFVKKLKSEPVAIALTTIISLVIVFGSIILLALLVAAQVGNIVGTINLQNFSWSQVESILKNLQLLSLGETGNSAARDILSTLLPNGFVSEDLLQTLQQSLGQALGNLFGLAQGLVQGGFSLFFYLFIFIVSVAYLFKDFEKLPAFLGRISPLDDNIDKILYNKFTRTTRAIVVGNFSVATVQASLMVLPLIWLGLDLPVLLWIIMLAFSLIPVGSGIVWVPVSISLMLGGNPAAGIALLVYGTVVVNSLEATLRPYLLKDSIDLHPLALIFSALGGISAFGPLGLLYGPLVAVFFASLMEAYGEGPAKISHEENRA